jgi:hypothetical protein
MGCQIASVAADSCAMAMAGRHASDSGLLYVDELRGLVRFWQSLPGRGAREYPRGVAEAETGMRRGSVPM